MKIEPAFPDRISLSHTPTPLQWMQGLTRRTGVKIYFKRDDFTGSELSGNKVRKLEFLLADAVKTGADTVLTCGGAQSNHCRATALAAVKAGLSCVLLLRTDDPANPPPMSGNIFLNRLAGARIVWITPQQYRERDAIFEREAERLRSQGRTPYVIPEGGSTALGAWGYVAQMMELADDLEKAGSHAAGPITVVCACGSGGTTAGLALGAHMLDSRIRVVGVNVCDDRDYFKSVIDGICVRFDARWPESGIGGVPHYEILDGYVGRGYALSRPEELTAIRDLVRLEGVVLDPVYTGKAFFGMMTELKRNPDFFGERIVFVHTGGLFGLFPTAGQFETLI